MPYKVLWIDDNIEDLRAHILYLGEKGYAVQGATNGRDGLALLEAQNFDAILLDEMMPGIGGLETLEGIRRLNEHIPVIMITKSEAEDLMTKAIGRRIDDYLVKPVSPLQIQAALKRQLEARTITRDQVTRDYLSHFADCRRPRRDCRDAGRLGRCLLRPRHLGARSLRLQRPRPARHPGRAAWPPPTWPSASTCASGTTAG